MKTLIRTATVNDAERLLEIYEHYVLNTAITFEIEVPTLEEFERRICSTLEEYPYIVLEEDGKVVGYGYVSRFKARAAYDWDVETSIYVDKDKHHRGYGRMLYEKLEEICREMNLLCMNACITFPDVDDEYANKNSVEFHRHLGYQMVGTFHKSGFKFKRWYNMCWMEKFIGEHTDSPEPVKKFSELNK